MFMYCFDDETKEELLLAGFNFIREVELHNTKAYLFHYNNKIKYNFSKKNKVHFSNKLTF